MNKKEEARKAHLQEIAEAEQSVMLSLYIGMEIRLGEKGRFYVSSVGKKSIQLTAYPGTFCREVPKPK